MNITQFEISADKTQMDITITDAAAVSVLRLWKNFDYQDFNKAIDLSGKLTGVATENIVVTLSDINETSFDGIYFLQAEDISSISLDVTADLTRYKECILEKIIHNSLGNICLTKNNTDTINAHTALFSLSYAVELNFVNEILKLLSMLQIYCSNECRSCGGYKNIEDYEVKVLNDPDIILDGGDIV